MRLIRGGMVVPEHAGMRAAAEGGATRLRRVRWASRSGRALANAFCVGVVSASK